MLKIAHENNDIIIHFIKDAIDKELLATFLENIELEQIRKKSKLTKKQAEILAKEIKGKRF